MKITYNTFESETDTILFEDQQLHFATQTFSFPGGEDEDGGDDNDEEENNDGDNKDKGNTSDDDNPPLDEDVVHSPLTTQPGGKPGNTKKSF